MKWEMPDLFADMPELSPVIKEVSDPEKIRIRLGTGHADGEAVYWRPDCDASRCIGLLGGADTGKSQLVKSLVIQLLRQSQKLPDAQRELGILVLDYKGDYNDTNPEFLEETGAMVLKLHNLELNPFALNTQARKPQLHMHTAMAFGDAMALSYGLNPIQKSILVQSAMDAYAACGITSDPETWDLPAPTFAAVHEAYCARPKGQHNDALEGIMDALAAMELFGEDPRSVSDRFRNFRGIAVVDLSGYSTNLKNLAAILILEQFCAQMYQSEFSPEQLKKLVLVDEADELLLRECPVLDRILSEGGRYGVGMVLSVRYPDCLQNLDREARGQLKLWVIHYVEDLKKAELCCALNRDVHDVSMERLCMMIRRLGKHRSMFCQENREPVEMEDLPFFEISRDSGESYLRQRSAEAEEPHFQMPELDITHLMLVDLPEELDMEPLEGLPEFE